MKALAFIAMTALSTSLNAVMIEYRGANFDSRGIRRLEIEKGDPGNGVAKAGEVVWTANSFFD